MPTCGRNCGLAAKASDFSRLPVGIRLAGASQTTMFTFRELEAWKQGMDLAERCYGVTRSFPRSELYGLANQLRRATASIPANLAEGLRRRSTRAFLNHVSIAIGSHAEAATCIELAKRLGFLNGTAADELVEQSNSVGRLLYGLYRALSRRTPDSKLSDP
jgi:four helix bundle protein